MLVDNTFAFGDIGKAEIKEERHRKMVEAIREANTYLAKSKKFRTTIIPTGEGLTFGVKL